MTDTLPFYQRRRLQITAAVLLAVFVLLLVVIPHVISHMVSQWLEENGNERVDVENVDFNPFTGSLAVHGLIAELDDTTPLAIDVLSLNLVLHKLFSKQVIIEGVTIEGLDVAVTRNSSGQLRIGGVHGGGDKSSDDSSGKEWGFAIDSLTLKEVNIDYLAPGIESEILVEVFELSDLASFNPEQRARIKLQGVIDSARVNIDGELAFFGMAKGYEGQVKVDGLKFQNYAGLLPETISELSGDTSVDVRLSTQLSASGQLTANVDGQWVVDSTQLVSESIKLSNQAAQWQGKISYARESGGQQSINLDGGIKLADTRVTPSEDLVVQQGSLSWSGESSIKLSADKPLLLTSSGELTSDQLQLSARGRDSDVFYEKLGWQGEINLNTPDGQEGQFVSGDLVVNGFRATSPESNVTLMLLEKLVVKTINARLPQQLSIARTEFNRLTVGKRDIGKTADKAASTTSAANYGQMVLDDLQYDADKGLSIKTIRQKDVLQTVRKTPEGEWNILRIVNLMKRVAKGEPSGDEKAGTDKKAAMPVRVDTIVVEGDSTLVFEDYQVNPRFRQTLRFNKGSLKKLDTSKPLQASPIEIDGVIGKRSSLNISGVVSPFAKQLTADLKGDIRGMPLPPLSTYSEQALGHSIESGELDADLKFKAGKGKLDGNNTIKLHQLEVKALSAEELKKQKAKQDVPLETGLAMLRDKNNTIKLELPITGDADNFKLDPSDIINQAVGKAVKQAAKSYLSVALFPYGTLLTVVEVAGENAMQINLDPIEYEGGSSDLSDKHKEYLAKVAKILTDRPEIHVKLCGVSNEKDRTALAEPTGEGKEKPSGEQENPEASGITDEQLLALAEERADNIEAHLVSQHKTGANRLISCRARLADKEDSGQPRTELSLR